ncbi:pilus assembly protein PilM [Nitrosomonas sp. ANs5]|uniref:pilus assembly protein PilM n=1 Tax=Nitrosomonas sp. ANs5 TaxID=3423941 RepID=UPI003D3410C1
MALNKSIFKKNINFSIGLLGNASRLIGVDVGAASVKMVEFSRMDKRVQGIRLERYVIEPIPAAAIQDGNINQLDPVGESIRRAWQRMDTRQKKIAMALPAALVITRKICLPADLQEDDLIFQVETEASQYIPFALDEVNLDFQVMGSVPHHPENLEVLLVASRRDKVEDRVAAAMIAGLKVIVMDVEQFAAQTIFSEVIMPQLPGGGRDKVIVLVDIGARNTRINVLVNHASVYMRDQFFGGDQLTQAIQDRYGLSLAEAEMAKRSGTLPESYPHEVLTPFRRQLLQEITRALQFFFTSTSFARVDYIFLSGGCACLPGLTETIFEHTQITTQRVNPFAGIGLSSRIVSRQLKVDAPALLIASGLARRGSVMH